LYGLSAFLFREGRIIEGRCGRCGSPPEICRSPHRLAPFRPDDTSFALVPPDTSTDEHPLEKPMQKPIVIMIAGLIAAACSSDQPAPTEFEVTAPLYVKGGNSIDNMNTHLTGSEEVLVDTFPSHPRVSPAQGQAIFRVDGNDVEFRLIASNIENVIMAHIHCGAFGVNGPIRMWLHPVIGTSGSQAANGGGAQDGVLASGTFSAAGVTCPGGQSLLDAMRAGATYVNVHTNDGVGGINTGPGDFPGGEIRGQID
jgi:hypothetical protein